MKGTGPYFLTTLETDVAVHPSQMNNNIVTHLKNNLSAMLKSKIFKHYGLIMEIGDVFPPSNGIIRNSDISSSSVHNVKFNVMLCNPQKDSIIVAKITKINNKFIMASHGPIKCIIRCPDDVNKNKFVLTRSAWHPKNENGDAIDEPLNVNSFIKVKIAYKRLIHNKPHIIAFCILDDYILDSQKKKYITESYNIDDVLYEPVSSFENNIEMINEVDGNREDIDNNDDD
jgi:DNA-directed RNA polymerase subunit E'/Rpb7